MFKEEEERYQRNIRSTLFLAESGNDFFQDKCDLLGYKYNKTSLSVYNNEKPKTVNVNSVKLPLIKNNYFQETKIIKDSRRELFSKT